MLRACSEVPPSNPNSEGAKKPWGCYLSVKCRNPQVTCFGKSDFDYYLCRGVCVCLFHQDIYLYPVVWWMRLKSKYEIGVIIFHYHYEDRIGVWKISTRSQKQNKGWYDSESWNKITRGGGGGGPILDFVNLKYVDGFDSKNGSCFLLPPLWKARRPIYLIIYVIVKKKKK